ncbi:MAG TPA: VanZ family protein [Chthoniobacterales bacterium]|jgi:VanZ family protein
MSASSHFRKLPGLIFVLPWILFGIWLVVLCTLSSLPGSDFGPMPFFGADKVVHFALFAAGAAPLTFALLQARRRPILVIAILGWLITILVAVGDEFHQRFTPGRSGMDLGDMTADALGAAFGVALTLTIYGWRPFKTHLPASHRDRAT